MSIQPDDPIKHVVVLMLENQSFDRMLGSLQAVFPDLDGVPTSGAPRTNLDDKGQVYTQAETVTTVVTDDPHHDLNSVLRQIGAKPAVRGPDCREWMPIRLAKTLSRIDLPWLLSFIWAKFRHKKPRMAALQAGYRGHFVAEYARTYPNTSSKQRSEIMGFYPLDFLPALHSLAREFTICDRWFSSLPGPTWANRFFFHTGTAIGTTKMPETSSDFRGITLFDQRTIYEELNRVGKSWRIYFHDIPQSLALVRLTERRNHRGFALIDQFETDVSRPHETFPEFVVVEPQYSGDDANDDHPPHDAMRAQDLIARIYNGIRANEGLWMSTLLVIVYDEHGGFYDHVEPPRAVAPDKCLAEYSFDQLGVRVPAVLVSPWVDKGVLAMEPETFFDHTSIGKYLCDKWGLRPLGKRMANALSIGKALKLDRAPRLDTLTSIPGNSHPLQQILAPQTDGRRNENQIALEALSHYLSEQTETKVSGGPKLTAALHAGESDAERLRRRVLGFLEHS